MVFLLCHPPNPTSIISQILSAKAQAFLHPTLLYAYKTEQERRGEKKERKSRTVYPANPITT